MLEITAAISVSVVLFTVASALMGPHHDAAAEQMRRIANSGGAVELIDEPGTVWDRLVKPLAAVAIDQLSGLLPTRLERHFDEQVAAAGNIVSSSTFSMLVFLTPLSLAVLGATAMLAHGALSLASVAVVGLFALFGVVAPTVWLRGRISRRQKRIERELPEAFDLIVVSAEAGLGLEGAIARVAEGSDGPLAEELRRALADMNLGAGRRVALQGLSDRTRMDSVRALVTAILQADQTGMGIAQVLRAQSDHLRTVRRQRAEEAAMKAPLKMLFPLLFFIFPSLFLVVLGPAMLTLMRTLGGGM